MSKQSELKVLEAYTRDVGRGIARIDYDTMDQLGLSTGDVIKLESIKSKHYTVAKCLPVYPSDEGKSILRTDGLVRKNVGIQIGDIVFISKVISPLRAERVIVHALESLPPMDPRYLADALENVAIVLNDEVMVPYFGNRVTFKVVETLPKDICIITQKTEFDILEDDAGVKYHKIGKAFKDKEESLTKELAELLEKEYTDVIGDKIIGIENQINKIKSVRKIAYRVLKQKEESS